MPDNNPQTTPNTDFENMIAGSNFHFPGKPALNVFAEAGTAPTLDPKVAFADLQNRVNSVPESGISPSSALTYSPLQVDTSGRYPYQRIGGDNEDLYGRGQGWLSKAFNGITKGLITAGTTFLNGTAGSIYGLEQVVTGHGLHSFFDNDVSNTLNEWTQASENLLPNYYTQKERDAKWWEPSNLLTANFVWDKLVKNLGFSIGAIYSGAVMAKGLGLMRGLIPGLNINKAAQVAEQLEQELSAVPPVNRFNYTQNLIRKASDGFNKVASFSQNPTAERAIVSAFGAATEGGLEALQGMNDFRNQKINEYVQKYGISPIGADLDKINDAAQSLGDARFGLNMALLTATNYIQLPKILGSAYKDSKAIANTAAGELASGGALFGTGGIRKTAAGVFERALPTKGIGKRLYQAKNLAGLLFSLSEAFEESAQYAIQKGVEDYYNKAYQGKGAEFLDSFGSGWQAAFRDKEGLESLLLGGLSGGLQQSGVVGTYTKENGKTGFGFLKGGEIGRRGATGYGGEIGRNTEAFINRVNNNPLKLTSDKWTQEMAASAARGVSLMHEQDALIRQGDVLELKDSEFDSVHNYLAPRIKYGRYDLVKEDIASYRKIAMSPDGLQKLKDQGFAAPSDTQQTFNDRLINFEKSADNINSLYQSLSLRYGGNPKYNETTIDKMVYAASKVADYDARIPQLTQNLHREGVDMGKAINDINNGSTSTEATREALTIINNMQVDSQRNTVTSDRKDEMKGELRDIIELSMRRKEFLKEYENIKKNPQQYDEANIPQRIETATLSQKQGRKTVQTAFDLGREYFLSTPVTREGNSIILFPTVTPLNNTLGGEVETELPTGETQFIKPSDYRKYPLSSVDNYSKEVEDVYKGAVKDVLGRKEFAQYKGAWADVDKNDVQATQDFVNNLDDKDLADAIVKEMRPAINKINKAKEAERKAAEELQKNAEIKKQLDEIEKTSTTQSSNIISPDAQDKDVLDAADKSNDYHKAPIENFLSKESDFYDKTNPKPHQKRRLVFLTNFASFQNTQEAANYKVLAITKNNEANYGLKGLRDWIVKDIESSSLTPEQRAKYFENGVLKAEYEPIIKFYAYEDKGKLYIVDTQGKKQGQLKGDVLAQAIDNGVFGTFHADLQGTYTFGEKAGDNNYVGSEEEFEIARKQFADWRKATLAKQDSATYPIYGVSRGVVLRDNEDKPVTQTALAKEEDLVKEKIITVPTKEGAVVVNGVSLNFAVGQPLLTNGSNVEFLNNRKFSKQEAENIFKLFREFATQKGTKEGQRIQNFLNGLLYMRPATNASPSEAQVYLTSKDGLFHFGASIAVPFTSQSFDTNKALIVDYLQNYYVKTNNKLLKAGEFEEAYVGTNGDILFRSHPSYSSFLLSDKQNVPYLRTKAIRQITPDDPGIISRYTTLQSNEFDFAPILKRAERPNQTPLDEDEIDYDEEVVFEEEDVPAFAAGQGFQKKEEAAPVAEEKPAPKEEASALPKGFSFRKGATEKDLEELEKKRAARNEANRKRDTGDFKLADPVLDYKKIDLGKELSYIKERTSFDVEILDNIIKTPNGLYAFGQYKAMTISLWKKAVEGTGYHEVFEGVYKQFLTGEQKDKIYRDFTSRKGSFRFFDGENYHQVEYRNTTEKQMKEQLADEFADYVLTKSKPLGFSIARWFENLWNFIKSIFSGEVRIIDDLFSKIDAGYYKSIPTTPLSLNETAEYKLADINYIQQYQTVRGVALQLLQEIINPNKTNSVSLTEFEETVDDNTVNKFYDDTYNRLELIYNREGLRIDGVPEDQIEGYMQFWENVKSDWPKVKELTNEYLKTYSIVEYSPIDRERNPEYFDDAKYFKNDAKNTASRSIKLLIATLPETIFKAGTTEIQSKRNESYMLEQVNYAKTFNGALFQVANLNSLAEKEAKIKELGQTIPNFARLYSRLTMKSNPKNPASVLNDWKLKVRFFNVMSKQLPTVWTQFNNADKTSHTGTINLDSSEKSTAQGWIDNLKNLALSGTSNMATTNEDGDLILLTKYMNLDVSSPEKQMNLLAQLQIPFTMEMYRRLSIQDRNEFSEAVVGLRESLKRNTAFLLNDVQDWQSGGNFTKIALAAIKSGEDYESTFWNLDGEQQTKFVATNKISRDVNDINNSPSLESLYEQLPHLEQVKDSTYLNDILFKGGKNSGFRLVMGYIQGTKDSLGRPVSGDNLSVNQRVVQEINQNLNDRYYIMVPADSKTQWMMQLKNTIPYKAVATGALDWRTRFVEKFTEYYNTEKADYQELVDRVGEEAAKKRAAIFREMSNNYTMNDVDFAFEINNFIGSEVTQQKALLVNYKVLQANRANTSYFWEGMDRNFMEREKLNNRKLTPEQINDILTFRTVNFMLNNVEMQKIFFGNILEYTDATKRYKLFLSPREASIHGEPDFNDYLNKEYNEVGNIKLTDNLLGKHNFSDFMTTATMSDVITNNDILAQIDKGYSKTNSTDASAISTIVGMRERRLKGGTWTEKDEQQFQFMMSRDRQLMYEDGVLANFNYPKKLKEHDADVVAAGNPNSSYVYVEKPIVSGHTDNNGKFHPLVDKFSIVSYSYAAVRNTNFRYHYVKMLKQDINYIIAESGRKVGNQGMDSFYNEDGSVNASPYQNLVQVPFSTFGVQTDTSSKKENQTRGTQITKLIILNLYDAGKPVSTQAHELAQHNISLLKEQVELGYNKLIKTFGAEDVNGTFRIKDKRKIVSLLRSELFRREVPDSLRRQIATNDENQLVTAFEAMPNYVQIKSILYAHVDKNLTSPKVNGAPKVQVSGALMEKYGIKRDIINGKIAHTSSGLKFYTKEEPWMEVLMPFHAAKKLRAMGFEWTTDQDLWDAIQKSPDKTKILSLVGFRIPTQELNSMDNIRIAGFLPEEMGDTIVVPEELTTKAGSDFDIDKLSTYIQNLYVDSNNTIRTIPYFGMGEDGKKALKKWASQELADAMIKEIARDEVNPKEALESLDLEASEAKAEDDFEKLYRQSIENEYFRNMQELLALPENYSRLVTPNTTSTLKSIRTQLVDLAPDEFGEGRNKTIVSPMYMTNIRHQGLSVKKLVGIAAVAQTGNALAQLSPVTINYDAIQYLKWSDREYVGKNPVPLLPHNALEGQPTLSLRKDRDGRFISDKISQYINGTVDVFKDAFLAQINFNIRTAGMYLMLERMGVPNSTDHPIVSLFMNQPVVREYVKYADVKREKSLSNLRLYNKFIGDVMPSIFNKVKAAPATMPTSKEALTEALKSSIEKFYNGVELNAQEVGLQKLLFQEFMKYTVYAQQLFQLQQATNYDTANLNDNYALFFKNETTASATANNVWRSPQAYLNTSFVGKQRDALGEATELLADVLTINNTITQKYLRPILEDVSKKYISNDDKIYTARKLEESLINFTTQTSTGIINQMKDLMVNKNTALVTELRKLKKEIKANDDFNSLRGNLILKQLMPYIKGKRANATKNITLAVKARDIFSKNLYNESFKELLYHPKTQDFARKLITLSFLQNGVSNSPISFKDSIPADEYSNMVGNIAQELKNEDSLRAFLKTGSFFRNSWNDGDIVKRIYAESFVDRDYPISKPYGRATEYFDLLKMQGKVNQDAKVPSTFFYPFSQSDSPSHIYYTIDYTKEGDEEPVTVNMLFQRVDDEFGIPVIVKNMQKWSNREITEEGQSPIDVEPKALYVAINAWGDGLRAQEHYPSAQPSVLENGVRKVAQEFDIEALGNFLNNSEATQPTSTPNTPEMVYEDFREEMFNAILTGTKDSSLDWRISIPALTQAQREKAVQQIRAGKETKGAVLLEEALKKMYDGGVVTMNRGRGNQAETVDFPLSEVFKPKEGDQGKLFSLDAFESFKASLKTRNC